MLILGSKLLQQPVMSLQTGGELGRVSEAVIDPGTLAIVAYKVHSPLVHGTVYMRIEDCRELSDIGFIVDSVDEFVAPGDIIKLDEVISYQFHLVGTKVTDEKRSKLGKVSDYTIDIGTFTIQQLTVRRPLLRSLSDTELLIHRSQITEINDSAIVVHSKAEIPEHTRLTTPGSYVNPFRKTKPAADSFD